MGFNPPVPQQDSNWEIRVAVLLSLLLQVLLIFLGPLRRRFSALWSRLTVWSCYLLADWVADLALGLILNNMGNIGGGGNSASPSSFGLKRSGTNAGATTSSSSSSSPTIFAFWTPFLLLHLGGPDTITAYSVEDNELWLRHFIGLLFELFSATVIFFCSLPGNPLIHGTVLMFIVGVIKYGERTYSLCCGSLERFRSNILGSPEPGRNYAKFMTEFDSKEKAGLVVEVAIPNGEASKAQKEMVKQEAKRLVLDDKKSVEARAYELFLIFRRLFVNLILSFKEQRLSEAFFLERPDMQASEAFEVIELELNFIYDMVYTKAPSTYTRRGWVLRCISSSCLVSALSIFFFLDKPGHQIQRTDVGITYALLLGGLALDSVALIMLLFSNRTKVYLEEESSRWFKWLARAWLITRAAVIKRWWRPRRWSGTVAQFNLISYCLGVPGKTLMVVAKVLGAGRGLEKLPLLQDFIFIHHQSLRIKYRTDYFSGYIEESQLLNTFFDSIKHIALKLTPHGDYLEIEKVFNCRGSLALDRHEKMIRQRQWVTDGDKIFGVIRDSVVKVKDFDESLLLWHIATDLCLLRDYQGPITEDASRMRAIAKTLSEYMLYLLIKQPEMLSARTGVWLMRYRDTCEEARRFFGSMAAWIEGNDDARRMLLSVNTSEKPSVVKGDDSLSVLFDAVILAKALRKLYEDLMWDIVAGVWMEMLLYAARKCPGSTHVQQLNRGGELITVIWLLMEHMGLGDMYNIKKVDTVAKIIVHDH